MSDAGTGDGPPARGVGHRDHRRRRRRDPKPRSAETVRAIVDQRAAHAAAGARGPAGRPPGIPRRGLRQPALAAGRGSAALPRPVRPPPRAPRRDDARSDPPDRPVVALVRASGPIHLGRAGAFPWVGPSVGSDSLGATLRAAGRDPSVKAVVLRVDSPGGSYVASDAIRREVLALRDSGRPVIASMATVAASGGYYIAMPCDVVVASPTTITGSIGVRGGQAGHQGRARPGRCQGRQRGGRRARRDVLPAAALHRRRVGAARGVAGSGLRGLHRQGRDRSPHAARSSFARSRAGGSGPARTPSRTVWSTGSAVWRRPSASPASARACDVATSTCVRCPA